MSLRAYSDITLSYWKQYADLLIGLPVEINIYDDEEEWDEIKKESFGDRYKGYNNGICRKHDSYFSIFLFCPKDQYLEEVFETYLHELCHAFLHFPREGKHQLELECEVYDWININFWQELTRLYKATDYLKGRPRKYNYSRKPTKKAITEANEQYQDHFFLSDFQKKTINQWIDNIVEMAKAFKRANDQFKKKQMMKKTEGE